MPDKKIRLMPLFLPIFLEMLFTMLAGMVDTFMLATEGDQAVGAVGTASSYISVFLTMFTIVSSGMLAVMTQYIGARRPGVAQQTLRLGMLVNLGVGFAVMVLLCFFAEPILDAVGIARDLREHARIYMQTVGVFSVCSALIPIYSSYLRAFGHTSTTLVASVFGNVMNLLLNAVFLYVLDMGVFGIALATGLSRLINLFWVWIASRRRIPPIPNGEKMPNKDLLKKIVRVGLPGALESCMYNLTIMLVISLLNRMDSTGTQAIARAYASQIVNFSLCAACSLAHANAIIVGWKIGAGRLEECDRDTRKNAIIGIVVAGCTAGVFALFAKPILSVFTQDPQMISLVQMLLTIDILLEMGRAVNMVFGFTLKATGDAAYPLIIAVIFNFLCAVAGTWFFGICLGWMAVGAYVGMMLDECTRALFMFLRWNKGLWMNKNLISDE